MSRDFTKLVRRRMKETGENYTKARAALLSLRGQPADPIQVRREGRHILVGYDPRVHDLTQVNAALRAHKIDATTLRLDEKGLHLVLEPGWHLTLQDNRPAVAAERPR